MKILFLEFSTLVSANKMNNKKTINYKRPPNFDKRIDVVKCKVKY